MSVERDELHRLIEDLPDAQVAAALADVRRHLGPVSERPWPPTWFGVVAAERTNTAARADEILADGFGRSA